MKKINIITRLLLIITFISIIFSPIRVHAASASITASKTTAYVGEKVTITVKITAGSWNLAVKGAGINDTIVGYDMDGNKTTTKTYTLNTSKTGTFTISLTGDITDYDTEQNSDISKSVTVTVKEKPVTNNNNNNKPTQPTQPTQPTKPKDPQPVEVISEITRFEIVGYDINFNKDQKEYELSLDEDVQKLYIIVEGKNIKVQGNNEVNIKDKDEINIKVIESKETKDYNIKLKRKVNAPEPIEEKKELSTETSINNSNSNNDNFFMISTVILTIILVIETLLFIRRANKKEN